jgi:hypothetical protein
MRTQTDSRRSVGHTGGAETRILRPSNDLITRYWRQNRSSGATEREGWSNDYELNAVARPLACVVWV